MVKYICDPILINSVEEDRKDYILISEACADTPYSQEYLSLLVRREIIAGKKFGRNWYVKKSDIENYIALHGLKIKKTNNPIIILTKIRF
ncbi:MAG: hypothetical protein Q8Q95_04595 [bacterium]|nr:hypothetical protein [bacterium]